MSRFRIILVLVFFAVLGFAACSDDPSSPSDPGVDELAPRVFSTEPEANDAGVSPTYDIVVVFSEAMDEATAAGNVTLSAGAITDLTWDDDRTLRIEHSAWSPATRVQVTLGTGIQDLAGNGLETPYTWLFWVATPDVILLQTTPEDGAAGVPRNARVTLRFNRQMNLTTLTAATTVDDGTAARAPVGFSYAEGPDDQVLMTFAEELPALATITVTIGTDATAVGGQPLAEQTSFSFQTGAESDTTPPTLISVVPADGSTIAPSTPEIVFTFSEAIDQQRLDPVRLGAQFLFLLEQAESAVTFSEDGTVLTVALPTPLPAGLPIYVYFEEFYDLAGNASTSPLEYRVDVAGTAEVWPWIAGRLELWAGTETSVEGAGPPVTQDYMYIKRIENQGAGRVRYASYFELPPVIAEDWETFERNASRIDFLGFGEIDEGTPVEVFFDDPVGWLPLPPTPGTTWSGSTTFPFGPVVADLDYSGEILGVEDLPVDLELPDSPAITWIDCWKVQVNYVISSGGMTLISGEELIWYAPTIGPVREMTHEEDSTEDRVSDHDEWFVPIDPEDL